MITNAKLLATKEAVKSLLGDNMSIIDKGYRSDNGQMIDLVAQEPCGDVTFALVQIYDHVRELPKPVITLEARQRLETSAMEWLEHHPTLTNIHFSFDLFDFNIINDHQAIFRRQRYALNRAE